MKKVIEATKYLQNKGIEQPEIGIILGTGLGALLDSIDVELTVNYSEIPSFAEATVEFHQGKLVYGTLAGKKVLAMAGRFHYYEGYSMQEISFPVRVMKELGIKNLIISNAAGGINLEYDKSDLMIIDDHINLLPGNPLIGKNVDEQGPRFPDMPEPYSAKLNSILKNSALKNNIKIREGVYVSVPGPNLETRAEYRFLKIIGADAVGMSTVPEVLVANHCNLPVIAVSIITNLAAGISKNKLSHQETLDNAGMAEKNILNLIKKFISKVKIDDTSRDN